MLLCVYLGLGEGMVFGDFICLSNEARQQKEVVLVVVVGYQMKLPFDYCSDYAVIFPKVKAIFSPNPPFFYKVILRLGD